MLQGSSRQVGIEQEGARAEQRAAGWQTCILVREAAVIIMEAASMYAQRVVNDDMTKQ